MPSQLVAAAEERYNEHTAASSTLVASSTETDMSEQSSTCVAEERMQWLGVVEQEQPVPARRPEWYGVMY